MLVLFPGPDSFILGDPNRGYSHVKDLKELSKIMIALNKAGMDGVEDPASLKKDELIFLQANVGALSIVPDHIMRPASKSIKYWTSEWEIILIFTQIAWELLQK